MISWSKQSSPNFIGNLVWRYNAVKDLFTDSTLKAWDKDRNDEKLIQERKAGFLFLPSEAMNKLEEVCLAHPET
ncbi:DUF2848 family protein [Bartonella sp. M0283]|nr:DUF2848 family protein [Bartonella sp. M0283]